MKTSRLLLGIVALAASASFSQAQLIYDFNNYTNNSQFLNDFTIFHNTGSNGSVTFEWVNQPGVGGNGVVQLNVAGNTSNGTAGMDAGFGSLLDKTMLSKTAFDLNSATGNITVSSLFQIRANTAGGSPVFAQIGLSGNGSFGFNAATGGEFITTRLVRNSGNGTFTFQNQYYIGGNTSTTNFSTSLSLTTNRWYELVLDFTKIGSNQISGNSTLIDRGVSGNGSTVVSTGAFSGINIGSLYNDSTTYVGARSIVGSSYVAYDNLSVIPEPSTVAMLLAVLAGGALFYRSRKNRK